MLKRRICGVHRAFHNPESGSVSVMTVIALGVIAGAFLYVAVIGGRVNETLRIRTAADAAALAAATTKARALNYASFLLVAESVLMPLSDVAKNIASVQNANQEFAACASMLLVKGMENQSQACINHVISTAISAHQESLVIDDILSALSKTAEGLDTMGATWAESVAIKTAEHSSYQHGSRKVDLADVFPKVTGDPLCARLGIDMVSSATPSGPDARKACSTENAWELAYVAMSQDLTLAGLDAWSWQVATGETSCAKVASPAKNLCQLLERFPDLLTANGPTKSLQQQFSVADLQSYFKTRKAYADRMKTEIPPALLQGPGPQQSCNQATRVPQLSADWASHSRSITLTMTSDSSDRRFIPSLESLRHGRKGSIPTGSPLGIACAEHYPTDTSKTTSLWAMGWRARLVPCQFTQQSNVDLVLACGGRGSVLGDQFQHELDLGIAKDWLQ